MSAGGIVGIVIAVVIVLALLIAGIRIVRPTNRGLVERLGKYNRYANPGFHLIIPVVERMFKVDIRETLVEAEPQMIITNDNLNARVDAQVYLKVKADEENVKASQYNVADYQMQIVNLARTTLRNIIGTLTLKSANSERGKINEELRSTLLQETANWGIAILRTELKEIDPPEDVQETMNKVVKAENEKVAAIDFATATETQADGQRRAEIKKAEGNEAGADPRGRGSRPRRYNSSTRRLTSTSSVTPRSCGSWRRWSVPSAQNAKVVVPGRRRADQRDRRTGGGGAGGAQAPREHHSRAEVRRA